MTTQPRKISPSPLPPLFKLGTSHLFRYRVGFIRDGKRHFVTPWKANLIQDVGLDLLGNTPSANCWSVALFGDAVSPVPTRRNTGVVTVSQSGNTLTASGTYFLSSDVGRLFKFDSGNEVYVTAFTDSTHVTCNGPSTTVSASPGTMWYVNESSLTSVYSTTATYGANGGDNGSSVSINVVTDKRTFVGPAVSGAPVTLTEIGFNSTSANTNVFDRDIISGGITLSIGDQPLAVAELVRTFNPHTSTAAGNVGTGFNSAGNCILCGMASAGYSTIASNGNSNTSNIGLEFNAAGNANFIYGISDPAVTLPAFNNGIGPNLGSFLVSTASNPVVPAYSSGNYFRDANTVFGLTDAIGTFYAFIYHFTDAAWCQVLTTPFAKAGTQILTVGFRRSWQRVLAN